MDEPRFAQPIPNVTVAVGRDANLPCVVEHLGTYKVRDSVLFITWLLVAGWSLKPTQPEVTSINCKVRCLPGGYQWHTLCFPVTKKKNVLFICEILLCVLSTANNKCLDLPHIASVYQQNNSRFHRVCNNKEFHSLVYLALSLRFSSSHDIEKIYNMYKYE